MQFIQFRTCSNNHDGRCSGHPSLNPLAQSAKHDIHRASSQQGICPMFQSHSFCFQSHPCSQFDTEPASANADSAGSDSQAEPAAAESKSASGCQGQAPISKTQAM